MSYNRKPGAWRFCVKGCGAIIGNKNKSGICSKCSKEIKTALSHRREEVTEHSLAQKCPLCHELDLLDYVSLIDGKTKICQSCYNKQVKANKDKKWEESHPSQLPEIPFGTICKVIGTQDPAIEFCDPDKLRCSKCGHPIYRDDPIPIGTVLFCEKCRKKILRHGSKEKILTLPKESEEESKPKKESKFCKCGAKLGNANKSGICSKCTQGAKKLTKPIKEQAFKEVRHCACGAELPKYNTTGKCPKCYRKDRIAKQKDKRQVEKKKRQEIDSKIEIRCEVCGEVLSRKRKKKTKGVPFLCRKHYAQWQRDQKDPSRVQRRKGIIVKCPCGNDVFRKKINFGEIVFCSECLKKKKLENKQRYLEKDRKPPVCEQCGTPLPGRKRRGKNMTLLCHECEKEKRKEVCSSCHQIRTVFTRLENGDPICGVCYRHIKQGLPIIPILEKYCACGTKLGHRNKSGICQECANKEKQVEKEQGKTVVNLPKPVVSKRSSISESIPKPIIPQKQAGMSRERFRDLFIGRETVKDDDSNIVDDTTGEVVEVVKMNPRKVVRARYPDGSRKKPERKEEEKERVKKDNCKVTAHSNSMQRCPKCKTMDFLDFPSLVTGEEICLDCHDTEIRQCRAIENDQERQRLFPFNKEQIIKAVKIPT